MDVNDTGTIQLIIYTYYILMIIYTFSHSLPQKLWGLFLQYFQATKGVIMFMINWAFT